MLKRLPIKIFALFLFFIFTFAAKTLSAQEIETSYKFTLDLQESKGSIGTLILSINNKSELQLVDRYQITIPIRYAENISVKLGDNIEENVKIEDLNGYKKVDIVFETPITNNKNVDLAIQFTSPELLKTTYGIKQLYIQNPFDNLQKSITYEINYPKSFGNIYRSYSSQNIESLNSSLNKLTIQSNNGIYVLWAEQAKVNLKTLVSARNESEEGSFYFNLPSQTDRQSVYVNSLSSFGDLFSDRFENLLGKITLKSNESKDIGFDIDVLINNQEDKQEYPLSYDFDYDDQSVFGLEIAENTQNLDSNYLKLQMFNQILRSKASTNKQAVINYDEFKRNIWKKLETNPTLNSFEFSALNVAYAEYLGLEARLEYGYIFISPLDLDTSRPQVWAVINVDDRDVFVDSFSEDMSNISYFDISYIDRVKFGTWHPTQIYNPAIGLAYESNPIRTEISDSEVEESLDSFNSRFEYPETAASGSLFTAKFKFENKSKQPLVFSKFLFNGEDILGLMLNEDGLIPVVSPNSTKDFEVTQLREADLFYNGSKEIKTEVSFKGFDEVSDSDSMNFYIDLKNLLIFGVIFFISICLLGFIFLRIRNFLRR